MTTNIETPWGEIQELETRLLEMVREVSEIRVKLHDNYRTVGSIINGKYTDEDFIEISDLTSQTLYFCLDPYSGANSIFYVNGPEGQLVPISFNIIASHDLVDEPTLEINLNPFYTPEALATKGFTPRDVLIKFPDLVPPIKNDTTNFMQNAFDNPPPPEEDKLELYEDFLKQRLHELTDNDEYLITSIN